MLEQNVSADVTIISNSQVPVPNVAPNVVNPEGRFSRIRNSLGFKIIVFSFWGLGQLILSLVTSSIVLSIGFALAMDVTSKKSDQWWMAIMAGLFLVSFCVFTPILRLALPNWKRAILLTLISSVLLIPITIFGMPLPAYKVGQVYSDFRYKRASKEANEYSNTVKISNIKQVLVDKSECKDFECTDNQNNKFIEVSFNMDTTYEGQHTFLLRLNDLRNEGYIGDFQLISPENILDKRSFEDVNLKPGLQHLKFVYPTKNLIDREISGPYRITLTIQLVNEEFKKARKKDPYLSEFGFTVYDNKNLYKTDSYKWDDFYVNRDPLRVFSYQFRKDQVEDKLGFMDIDLEVWKAGEYVFRPYYRLFISGNTQSWDAQPKINKVLAEGRQKLSIPYTIYEFGSNPSMDNVKRALVPGYEVKIEWLSICTPQIKSGVCTDWEYRVPEELDPSRYDYLKTEQK